MPTVEWPEIERKNASYRGRNGIGKCYGIAVVRTSGYFTTLQPINSKGFISDSAILQIPEKYVNRVCGLIQKDLIDLILTNLKDQLPRLIGLDPVLDELVSIKLKEK
ncbi:MAG: hypothetical protein NT096_00145 [Proteobacteria bacterium]|nr:hypothetical protein [Pseudomonadota bacterium]